MIAIFILIVLILLAVASVLANTQFLLWAVVTVVGIYWLLRATRRLAEQPMRLYARRLHEGRCPHCGYDKRADPGGRCPECGQF